MTSSECVRTDCLRTGLASAIVLGLVRSTAPVTFVTVTVCTSVGNCSAPDGSTWLQSCKCNVIVCMQCSSLMSRYTSMYNGLVKTAQRGIAPPSEQLLAVAAAAAAAAVAAVCQSVVIEAAAAAAVRQPVVEAVVAAIAAVAVAVAAAAAAAAAAGAAAAAAAAVVVRHGCTL
eukprot:18661-Heterococcus_DN1.PRE.5